MPVEIPRTPDFADALEARLREDTVKRPVRRGPEIVTAVVVVAALGGGASFVLTTAGEDAGPDRVSPAARSLARPSPFDRAVLGAPGTGAPRGTVDVVSDVRRCYPDFGSKALRGLGPCLRITARGLPASSRYAVWVGRDFLGFAPPVGRSGSLRATAAISAGHDSRVILVTREATDRPRRPGDVVLRATLSTSPSAVVGSPRTGTTPVLPAALDRQASMRADGGGRALGVARMFGSDTRFLNVRAEGLPASDRYGVWIAGRFAGFLPPVYGNGTLDSAFRVVEEPEDAAEILLTRETVDRPRSPGDVVLRGRLP